MTEKEVLEKIKKTAEQVAIPESLSPETIEKMLNKTKKQGVFNRFAGKKMVAAASVLFVCGVCGIGAVKSGILGASSEGEKLTEGVTAGAENERMTEQTAEAGNGIMTEQAVEKEGPKQDAGEMYQVASCYEEVYQLLDKYAEDINRTESETVWIEDGTALESAVSEKYNTGAAIEESVGTDASDATGANNETAEENASDVEGNYSTTNLQTQGVDESDIVKTDGKYIYTVSQNKVLITDIRGEALELEGEIKLELSAGMESVLEMYVDNGKLILITSQYDTTLETNSVFGVEKPEVENQAEKNNSSQTGSTDGEVKAVQKAEIPAIEAVADKEEQTDILERATEAVQADIQEITSVDTIYTEEISAYYIERNHSTNIYTYDVANPKTPLLLGKVNQDGDYYTSRKIGDVVYLFTNKSLGNDGQPVSGSVRESGAYLPLVNGEEIPYDCIYLPKEGSQGLIISSVNVNNPSAIVDKTMILNNYVEIYVGNESCYLYNTIYQDEKDFTEIAKFSFTDGKINAVNAATVEGEIYDTFAINEKNGKLRVLTTEWDWSGNGERSNSLYLLDENLSLTGALKEIAPGEDIYAARYIGEIVYFITYRNTDPLFAADISDETAPKLLGELEITGFSEYLHPWGDDKLLGIGYETDPETGNQEGIKLVMFDISNPTELKVIDTVVIENVDYCAALYNYKCIIAEESANIIGFTTERYTSSYYQRDINYLTFSWENGKFVNLLAEGLTSGVSGSIYRGIYAGDRFFIASPEQIRSFDRTDSYKKTGELVF